MPCVSDVRETVDILKHIRRQIQLDKSAVNVQFIGLAPEGRCPLNRHRPSKPPIGQHEVKNWPVLDLCGEAAPARAPRPGPHDYAKLFAWKGAKWLALVQRSLRDGMGARLRT
jgi:hypothetical protein